MAPNSMDSRLYTLSAQNRLQKRREIRCSHFEALFSVEPNLRTPNFFASTPWLNARAAELENENPGFGVWHLMMKYFLLDF